MIYSYYIITIFIATILSWSSFLLIINKLSPFISGYLALSFFYLSLFIALMGSFTLINYYSRLIIKKENIELHDLNIAIRQSSLMSIFMCICLGFQRLRILNLWDAFLLLIIIVLIEYYFSENK